MNITDLNGIVIVTGTDTDVGKTVTTAVIASALKQSGKDVTIIKPYQTGLDHDEPGDVHDAGRLASIDADNVLEYVRCPEQLAPTTSAARAGMTFPRSRKSQPASSSTPTAMTPPSSKEQAASSLVWTMTGLESLTLWMLLPGVGTSPTSSSSLAQCSVPSTTLV